jgi:leucyl/phenylalanyl-tRNA--protein transferase
MDQAFSDVISHCQTTLRPNQEGTWITDDMRACYNELHRLGFAHSVEVWQEDDLVGGLYGVSIGQFFAGESMFAQKSDASKFALVYLTRQLQIWGFPLIDCQMHTEHLAKFGAETLPRASFLTQLAAAVTTQGRPSKWRFDESFQPLP